MTINLNTAELTGLVEQHVNAIGLKGDYKITFKARNQNNIDTSIEILPANAGASIAATETQTSEAIESVDSLIQ